MQIRVKCNCAEGNCSEWAIVELQGVVEAQPSFQDRLKNLEIGVLCRPSSQEVYTLTIGYHELTGSKIPLKKPILMMKKIKQSDVDSGSENNCNVELQVIGIIRHRILFKTRPKALVSRKYHSQRLAPPSQENLGSSSWLNRKGQEAPSDFDDDDDDKHHIILISVNHD